MFVNMHTCVGVRPPNLNTKFLFGYLLFNFPRSAPPPQKEKCVTFYLCILWNPVNNGQLGMRIAKETARKEIQGVFGGGCLFEPKGALLIFRFQSGNVKVRWEQG